MAAAAGFGAVSCPVPCRASDSSPSHRVRMQGKGGPQGEGAGRGGRSSWSGSEISDYLACNQDLWVLVAQE